MEDILELREQAARPVIETGRRPRTGGQIGGGEQLLSRWVPSR